jgi:hypothetical protein
MRLRDRSTDIPSVSEELSSLVWRGLQSAPPAERGLNEVRATRGTRAGGASHDVPHRNSPEATACVRARPYPAGNCGEARVDAETFDDRSRSRHQSRAYGFRRRMSDASTLAGDPFPATLVMIAGTLVVFPGTLAECHGTLPESQLTSAEYRGTLAESPGTLAECPRTLTESQLTSAEYRGTLAESQLTSAEYRGDTSRVPRDISKVPRDVSRVPRDINSMPSATALLSGREKRGSA